MNIKKILVTFIATVFSMGLATGRVEAKVIMQEKGNVTIPSGETIDDDLFVAAETVEINGTVNGDVYAGAGTLRIGGTIKGALVVGAGDLTLTKANIANSLIVGAGNVTIDEASKIGGSLISGTGDIKNSGAVGRNVMIGAGSIYLNGPIGKEARIGAGTIELGSKFKLNGDLTYTLGDEGSVLTQDEAAVVSGEINRFTPPEKSKAEMNKAKEDLRKLGMLASRGWLLFSFLSSLLIGFIFIKLFPKTMAGLASIVSSSPMRSLGIGLLIIVVTIPVLLALTFTIIGIPLSLLLLVVLSIDIHIAKLVCSFALGQFVAKQLNLNNLGIYASFAIGVAIFYFLRAVPGLGMIVSVLFTWTGLGAIWTYMQLHLKSL